MKTLQLRQYTIRNQLRIASAVISLGIIYLGSDHIRQSGLIYSELESIHNHSLQVRRAVDALDADVLRMRLGLRDLMLANNDVETRLAMQVMEEASADVDRQFVILLDRHRGPIQDVLDARQAFDVWNAARAENIQRAMSGEQETLKASVRSDGDVGKLRDDMLAKIQKIDDDNTALAQATYENSRRIRNELNVRWFVMIAIILLVTALIHMVLVRNLSSPLKRMTDAAIRFSNGDTSARSGHQASNELGVLSEAFDSMAASIEQDFARKSKLDHLKEFMLAEQDSDRFSDVVLAQIAQDTGAQAAAVYVLSEQTDSYELMTSVGLSSEVKTSFKADRLEGELGFASSLKTPIRIKDIPTDTSMNVNMVAANFAPREIITVPVVSNDTVIGVLSLISIKAFNDDDYELVNHLHSMLLARIERLIAKRRVTQFAKQLESRNRELNEQRAELQQQNVELESQKSQLKEASQLKTNFLSNMSHELRTPLNSVIALSGVLNRRLAGKIPDDEYSYIDVIERNGRLLLNLINDILDISKIETGHVAITITEVNLASLVRDVMALIKPQIGEKPVKLTLDVSDSLPLIKSDENLCRHILQNLVSNAVKFTDSGSVDVRIRLETDQIAVMVKDTGIGISEKQLPHIFDEFRQADGGLSRKYGGTGLGLAIAKKYTNLLNGQISVNSTLGEGTTFTVRLPIHQENEAEPQLKGNQTLLLVDDSEPAIIQMKEMLEDSGYRILVASNGFDALDLLGKESIDAVLLDLMMPVFDGFEVLKAIRNSATFASIPVLVLTAKTITQNELADLKHNRVFQLVQKGDVQAATLLGAVRNMLVTSIHPHKPRVLVVEDNPDNRLTIRALLSDDYMVTEAVNGRIGIEQAKLEKPDLILMDIDMPEVDGIEAFLTIRNSDELDNIPIIALTANALISDRDTLLAQGFNAHIPKPIDSMVFYKTIHEVLNGTH